MNRKTFYATLRTTLFKGKLADEQVAGMEAILNEWQRRGLTNLNWLAYMLATVYHETATTMRPIEEYGKGRGRDYGKIDPVTGKAYYGRGFVQLTWKYNYQKFANKTGIDLVRFPEKACDLPVAVQILFDGMINGMFTGVRLGSYFNDQKTDWEGARRIINGTDKASLIADYAYEFYLAIREAMGLGGHLPPKRMPPYSREKLTDSTQQETKTAASVPSTPLTQAQAIESVPQATQPPAVAVVNPLEQATAIAKELTTGDNTQPWWQRALGSKIVLANLLAIIGTGGILPLIDLSATQQADLATGLSTLIGGLTIVFRVWFNRQR